MAVRADYTGSEPGGGRLTTKFYGIDAQEHATAINANETAIAGKQAADADLTAIAGLSPSNDDVVQRKSGAWTNRTPAQLKTDLALTKTDVGLSNVTNNAQYYAGGTDVAVADGGTGASDAAGARTNLGLVIGTNVLGYVAPSTAGYILGTSDGTTWTAQPLSRVNSTASSATPAINTDTTDEFDITALATNITSMTSSLTGTPRNGQTLMIRFKDNGTARTITWGASFQSSGVATLLATTVINKTHYVGLRYDSAAAKWICLAVDAAGY